jgi:LuxR family maltose regulon positive regulatory protein
MFERLSGEMVEFILRGSILDRLSAPLCVVITGLRSSQRMLDGIADGHFLLQALVSDGQWFRYYNLSGEYLRAKLEAQRADEVAELHCCACEWYGRQELWTEAVKHAIAAGVTDNAMRLMERCAMALVKKGDLLSLLGLQRRLLAVLASAQVEVTLAIAWGMGLATHFEEALATAEPYLERPSADTWITNVVPNVVRLGRLKGGHREALCATPWMPYPIEERRRNLYSSIYRLCLLGHAQRWNSCNLSLPSGISRIRCDWPNDMPVPIRSR